MADKFAVGVDFGGTKISAGVVNVETGRLVSVGKKKTRQVSEQEDVLKRITAVIDEALLASEIDLKKVTSIGIGAAGQVKPPERHPYRCCKYRCARFSFNRAYRRSLSNPHISWQ